jgi:hypothetical protein
MLVFLLKGISFIQGLHIITILIVRILCSGMEGIFMDSGGDIGMEDMVIMDIGVLLIICPEV